MTMQHQRASRPSTGLTLRVPKRTMTPGDTLIAWGLAILAGDVLRRAILHNKPEWFEIEVPRVTLDTLHQYCASYRPGNRVRLPWLASTEKKNWPADPELYAVDRDRLRDDYKQIRAMGQGVEPGGDAPAAAGHALALKYPHFQALTNPGTQWKGYNSFVELCQKFWQPAGVEAIVRTFATELDQIQSLDLRLDELLKGWGVSTKDRRKNPPGFLFPGGNKGPTMRLNLNGGTIGQSGNPDWMMADRGDLSIIERYLAYVGYFAVASIRTYRGGRVVSVPVPDTILVPAMIATLSGVAPRAYPSSPGVTASDAALAFSGASLEVLVQFQGAERRELSRPSLLRGVDLSVFWMPSGNTYAANSVTFVPLPTWLEPLFENEGYDVARETLVLHRRRIGRLGQAEGGEAREAAGLYRESLAGGVFEWLKMIPAWQRAAMAEKYVGNWRVDEIERIALVYQPELKSVIHDPAFQSLTGAIRRVTIVAHYARQAQKDGVGTNRLASGRAHSRLSPQYDLIGTLQEAAARHPDEFLKELCDFVAEFNDAAARPGQQMRLIRIEDLEQIIEWMNEDRRGLIPSLIIAFGASPHRRAKDTDRTGDEGSASDDPTALS